MVDDSSGDRDPVEVLAEEFLERLRKGEHPSLAEYKERYPDLAEDIDDVFPALAMMDEIDPSARELSEPAPAEDSLLPKLEQLGDFRIIREVGRGGMGVVYEAEQVSLGRHVALKVLPSSALPDSKHVRRFEREAKSAAKLHHTNIVPVFGVGTENDLHYYVMQFIQGLPLDEVIEELKKIRSQPTGAITAPVRASQAGGSSRDARERSVADVARSLMTGQFAQTQIGESDSDVDGAADPVQTVTEISPQAGDTSTSRLSETFNLSGSFSGSGVRLGKSGVQSAQRKPLTYWQSVANIGMQVADALHYAHEQGILHRDIKPSNLLLDLRGTTWVTDFGLAKATDQQDITHTGDILGTLRYMPPEAFEGKTDARSDVYSLGLTLYELLAFQPAFGNRDRHQLVKQVTTEAAPRLDRLNPEVPRDLVTIVHKAIDHDPAHRYQTARELEEDLQRFLEDEPIKARRISLAERFSRWSRRNRGLAVSLAVVCVLLLVINIAGPLMYWRMAGLKRDAEARKQEVERTNQQLVASEQREKERAEEMEDLAVARDEAALAALAARDEALETRYEVTLGAALQALTTLGRYLHGKDLLGEMIPRPGEEDRRGLEYHVVNSLPDPSGGRILANIGGAFRNGVCFSPDDNYVAVADGSGDILILDAETGTVLKRLVGHTYAVRKLVWAAGGSRLVSGGPSSMRAGRGNSVRVWDVESGLEMMSLPGDSAFALSPDETRLAIWTNDDGLLQVRDISNGELLQAYPGDNQYVNGLDWSVEDQIALGGSGEVRLLDMESGEWHTLPGVSSESESSTYWIDVRFSPDGRQLTAISMSHHGEPVGVWNLESTDERRALPALMGVTDVAWSHDGSRLATASFVGRAVEIWEPATGKRVRRLSGHSESVGGCAWSHDDRQVVSTSLDGTVRIWEMDRDVARPQFDGDQPLVRDLAWSPDGQYFATASYDIVQIWDVRSPRESVATFRGHQGRVFHVDWHPGTNRLVSSGREQVLMWEWKGGNDTDVIANIPAVNGRNGAVWSPDGTQIAAPISDEYHEDYVRTYDALTGEKRLEFPLDGATSVSWERDRDGNSLLAAAGSEEVTVWNVDTKKVVGSSADPNESYSVVALSPQGDRVAFCGDASGVDLDGESTKPILGILDLNTRGVRRLRGHEGSVMSISWTADGTRLLTAGQDGTAILWNAKSGRQLVGFDGAEPVSLYAARISPDQLRIAIAGARAGVQMLDATPSYVEELAQELEGGLTARIDTEPTAHDLVLRGRVLAKQGRWDEAAADFDRAGSLSAAGGAPPSWFETTWWVAGPYAERLIDPQPPEQQTNPSQPIPATDDSAEERAWNAAPFSSSLDLGRTFDHQEHISAYAVTKIYATEPQTIGLLIGANDKVKIWSNGTPVHTRTEDSEAVRDDEAVEIALQPGWNTLLVKVTNNTGAHGLFARFSEDPRELAQAFDRNEQWEQALKWADRALAESPDDIPLLFVRGRAALRSGERQIAEESFRLAIETVVNKDLVSRKIAGLCLEHARSLSDTDQVEEAAASLDRARDLYEQLVQSGTANEGDAGGLADILLMTMPRPTWTVLEPVEMKSALGEEGATLTRLEDGSILAGGKNPDVDTYELTFEFPLQTVTAMRLEALTDDSLPHRGPGRNPDNGTFSMSWRWWRESSDTRLYFKTVSADYYNPRFHIKPNGWNIGGGQGQSHEAVYRLSRPVEHEEGMRFRIEMRSGDNPQYPKRAIGRFRISVTDDPSAYETEANRLASEKLSNGWERLAAAYHATGDEAALEALQKRKPHAAAGLVALTMDLSGGTYFIDSAAVTEAIETALRAHPDSDSLVNSILGICENASDSELRMPGFQALIDQQRAIGAPDQQLAETLRHRGALYVRAGEWERAAADYAEAVKLDTTAESTEWMNVPVIYAYLGDAQSHRDYCREMADHFETLDADEDDNALDKALNAFRVLVSMLLLEPESGSDLQREDYPLRAFLGALEGGGLNDQPAFQLFQATRALWVCRFPDVGDPDEARQWLGVDQSGGLPRVPSAWALHLLQLTVQALIEARHGDPDEARALLNECKSIMENTHNMKWLDDGSLDGSTVLERDLVDHALLIPEILRREAERLLEDGADGGTVDSGESQP